LGSAPYASVAADVTFCAVNTLRAAVPLPTFMP
jgi:hypothetical protein